MTHPQTPLLPQTQQRLEEEKELKPPTIDKAKVQREWKHILVGAMALTAIAGFVNAITLEFFDIPISHMSGAVTRLSTDIGQQQAHPLRALLVIFGFIFGAIASGFIIGVTKILPARRYGVIMMVESVLLFISALLLDKESVYGPMMASIACGLQNGMTTTYCGLMIRTTHVTGLVTDIGIMIGQWLRHRRIEGWKLNFHLAILVSFLGGGIVGTWLGIKYGHWCMALPAAVCFCMGLTFFTVMQAEINARSGDDIQTHTGMFPND